MTSEELNIKVAEARGWMFDRQHWFRDGDNVPSDPPAYTTDLNAAFSLLDGQCFNVFTCDFGYSCKIYTAPEQGEEELAEGLGDSVAVAICKAFVKLKGAKA